MPAPQRQRRRITDASACGPSLRVDSMEGFSNFRVAVVDDDPLVRESLAEILQGWGLRTETFARADEALEILRRNGSDVILLDLFIYDLCGLDFITRFGEDVKIIIITGFADKDTAIRALKLGAFDLLEKPFQNELLYHSVLRALTALENERVSKRLIADLERSRSELLDQQQRLEYLNTQLLDTNRALSIFAQNIELEREETEKRIALKLRNLIIPMVTKLKNNPALRNYEGQLNMLTRQIEDLTSGFAMDSRVAMALSSTEVQIASLIKNGVTTEGIARQLHIAESTVRTHRKNIRKKLKINNAQFSLRSYLNARN
ncbi:MAG TPA: DNA-binding response regulator [Syntrophobacteraceae bacterium]|nr:DNA-binding response regulator [Syntrophobacteraceae bacterium]